jgi:hypothetical protein
MRARFVASATPNTCLRIIFLRDGLSRKNEAKEQHRAHAGQTPQQSSAPVRDTGAECDLLLISEVMLQDGKRFEPWVSRSRRDSAQIPRASDMRRRVL